MEYKVTNEEGKRREEDYTFGMKEAVLCLGMPSVLLILII
tara:strand:- start:322 stop:441 length:120 start_codon:yes stop_codon:yes gene_type:complete